MKKYNLDSAKFFSLVVAICAMFVFLVWNAFNYLPKDEDAIIYQDVNSNKKVSFKEEKKQESNLKQQEDGDVISEEFEEEVSELDNKDGQFKIVSDLETGNNELEIQKKVKKEEVEDFFNEIEVLKLEQNYNEAIAVCEKALLLTTNNEIKANIQEEIANLYAKLQRYDSALSYAQKAYNFKQTIEREILLARLYYKMGDTNRAQVRLLNVLKREF